MSITGKKLYGNRQRDERNQKELKEMGWNVIMVWECQLKKDKREETLDDLYNQITTDNNAKLFILIMTIQSFDYDDCKKYDAFH